MAAAIFIVIFCLSVILGGLNGFFKRYSRVAVGGPIVIFTLLLVRIVGSGMSKESNTYGIIMLIVSIVSLLLFMFIFLLLQKLLKKAVEARREYSHYKNSDDVYEQEYYVMDAVDKGDKKAYKRERKKLGKIKDKAGVWGIVDMVGGSVSGALNAAVIACGVIMGILIFADVSNFLPAFFEPSLTSSIWTKFGASFALDLILIGTVYACINSGYKNGISSFMCLVVVLALMVGFGAGAFAIASSDVCAGMVENLAQGTLSIVPASEFFAKLIIAAVIFLLSCIVIILVGIFMPKLVDKLRENKIFSCVDGVFGAIIACAVIVVAFMALGGIAYSLHELPFMEKFNVYEVKAYFGGAMYDCNPLGSLFEGLSLGKLLGGE